ncbi:MotA/TolQ/ExbB proton channel family protein [Veillonella sp.]|uniref:MotA/TolQ/ExbB proton channel family protein n=1 Tax=Veillonella sp. TaxID=1926307 RepID=UPI0028FEE161|nr:MotA/TolQ/ExbB proton channel family protein [Veillonella sp.]MDU1127677.1 MotA/TolQ/ExbB proton channel family protein [Veillonella sp.]
MSSITHLFAAGGFVMYPLVIFLVVTLMIGIERFLLYRKFRKDMRQFTAVLNNHPGWIMLPTVLERDTQNLGTLFAKALSSAKNYNGLENRLQDLVGYTDERLKRGLGWLSMIVTMAPLLGLLGTVLGMIRAFAVVGGDIGAPTIITGGVSEALVATATGLTVAIIALAFHSYCAAKVNDFIVALEHECGSILDAYNEEHDL